VCASCKPNSITSSLDDGRDAADEVRSKNNLTQSHGNEGPRYDGIDVSSHQGKIDWKKLAYDRTLRFAYIKATEGATYVSPHYGYNVTRAHRYGLPVGSYHYMSSKSSVEAQFRNFVSHVNITSQELIPMIDVEDAGEWTRIQLIDSVRHLADLLEAHYGKKPMIYSTMDFYNKYLAPHFNDYPLYIGRYDSRAPRINWQGTYTIWQFSENGTLPGINAYVDLCRFAEGRDIEDIALKTPRADYAHAD